MVNEEEICCAPGNAGIAEEAECVPIGVMDTAGITAFCKREAIDLVVVGPEAPLVAGLVDALEAGGIAAFGPTKDAAALEGSKGFMKDLCAREGIPTAAYRRFTDADAAKAYIAAEVRRSSSGRWAGGEEEVVVAATIGGGERSGRRRSAASVGAAGARRSSVEKFLTGEEASFFALCDGTNDAAPVRRRNHKRVGGSDALAPIPAGWAPTYSPCAAAIARNPAQVMDSIILPTVRAMANDGRPFKGVLFADLMLTMVQAEAPPGSTSVSATPNGSALMMRLQGDIVPALLAARDGVLNRVDLCWRTRPRSAW